MRAEAAGHDPRALKVEPSLGAGWLILDIFLTGFVGILVDALTGAWNNLEPWDIDLKLSPTAPPGKGGPGGQTAIVRPHEPDPLEWRLVGPEECARAGPEGLAAE